MECCAPARARGLGCLQLWEASCPNCSQLALVGGRTAGTGQGTGQGAQDGAGPRAWLPRWASPPTLQRRSSVWKAFHFDGKGLPVWKGWEGLWCQEGQ